MRFVSKQMRNQLIINLFQTHIVWHSEKAHLAMQNTPFDNAKRSILEHKMICIGIV